MDEVIPPLTPEVLVPRIGEYLVEKGLISTNDLRSALAYQETIKNRAHYPPLLGHILVQLGKITRSQLDQAVTEQILQLRQALQNANQNLEQRVQNRTAQLEEALKKLAEANKEKNDFVANISHELRTPLTHIKGYLNLLQNHDLGALLKEQDDALQVMGRATDRLEQLIEDLILLSSSQREQQLLEISEFSIIDLSVRMLERKKNKADQQHLSMGFKHPDNVPYVQGDEQKIGWVISQLLDNAIKFTRPGGLVKLELENVGQVVMVSVIDNGIGIPEDRIQEIFEPFHQLDGSSTRKFGGTGLGLTLAKKIIESHGSLLNVYSKPEQGSHFEFILNAVVSNHPGNVSD